MNETAVLRVRDLRVHFPIHTGGFIRKRFTPLKAVDGVSFELKAGESLGVVGESGCGKSTLGRGVLQLLDATGGTVLWLDDDLSTFTPEEMRKKRKDLQLVFQDPLASLNPRMTVGDIISEPLTAYNPDLPKDQVEAQVDDMMRRVGLLAQMRNRYPHEFSGGQCQRISIARAMINRPKLVVLDEPVSALDVSIQAQIVNLLKNLQREFKLAYIFISHDLSIVRHFCDRILVMYLGQIVEEAPRNDLFSVPLHPYTQALINAVPIPDPQKERAQPTVVLSSELPSPLHPPSGCRFRTRCPHATDRCSHRAPIMEEARNGHKVSCYHWTQIRRATSHEAAWK